MIRSRILFAALCSGLLALAPSRAAESKPNIRAIRQGDWKLLNIRKSAGGSGEWELFNIKDDAGKTRDLSRSQPAKRKALLALWDEYAKANGVILTDDGPYVKNAKPSLEQN